MPQHLSAVALLVRDYDEAIAYYTETLGFVLVEDSDLSDSQPGKRWVRVKPPGAAETSFLLAKAVGAEQENAIGKQSGGRVFLFLSTDDFWRDYNQMFERGVEWVRPPITQPYGTVAVFRDLYGNQWDLIGPGQA